MAETFIIDRPRTVTVSARSDAAAVEHAVKVTRVGPGWIVAGATVLPGNRNPLRTQRTVKVTWRLVK